MAPVKQPFVGAFEPPADHHMVLGSIAKDRYITWRPSGGGTLEMWKTPHKLLAAQPGSFHDAALRAENDSGVVAWITRESSHQGVFASWYASGWQVRLLHTHDYVTELTGVWVSDTGIVFVQEGSFGLDSAPSIHTWDPRVEGATHTIGPLPTEPYFGYVVGALGNEFLWRNTTPAQTSVEIPITPTGLADYGSPDPLSDGDWWLYDTEFTIPEALPYDVVSTQLGLFFQPYLLGGGVVANTLHDTDFLGVTWDTHWLGTNTPEGGFFDGVTIPSEGDHSEQMLVRSFQTSGDPTAPDWLHEPQACRFIIVYDTSELGGGTVELRSAEDAHVLSSVPVSDYVDESFWWPQTKGRVTYVGILNPGGCG